MTYAITLWSLLPALFILAAVAIWNSERALMECSWWAQARAFYLTNLRAERAKWWQESQRRREGWRRDFDREQEAA